LLDVKKNDINFILFLLFKMLTYNDNDNDNDNAEDYFIYQIDLSIETGNINYIKNAVKKYKGLLSVYYIDWANRVMMDLIQESVDDMEIGNN
tara:strand:- start:543 stop:818 length:276 start_codon:yes stop_codon:yes gene_type:complete